MNPADFTEHGGGEIRWSDNGNYCYFKPNSMSGSTAIPLDLERRFFRTTVELSRLDGRVSAMRPAERDLILSAFALKEATTSSAIEGTRSTVGDIYMEEKVKEKDPEKVLDNQEVRNYKDALSLGLALLPNGGITLDLILKLHKVLLDGVRGSTKNPGRFRDMPVALGRLGDSFSTAKFVPPMPAEADFLMKDLVRYMSADASNPLLKVALTHYQFEAIHPFTDGNGRMGRLLIMLMLCNDDVMKHPVLYLSEYFNRNRTEYTERLYRMSTSRDEDGWFGLFLDAMDSQIFRSMRLIDSLEDYRARAYGMIGSEGKQNITRIVDMLFENPYITARDVTVRLGVSPNTSYGMIDALVSKNILTEITGRTKGRLYLAKDILEMLEN